MTSLNPLRRAGTVKKVVEEPLRGRALKAAFGWLPGVTKQDAIGYAQGIAVTNSTNADNARVFAMEYDGGYAYEVQEGGQGKPYLPSILALFTDTESRITVYVSTSTRTVQIEKDTRGLSSVWLPEDRTEPTTEGVTPGSQAMVLAIPDASSWKKFGLVMLVAGVFTAVIPVGVFSIALPIIFSSGAEELSSVPAVPIDRWASVLTEAEGGKQVKSLEYTGGRWEVKVAKPAALPIPAPTPLPGGMTAQPGAANPASLPGLVPPAPPGGARIPVTPASPSTPKGAIS